MAVESSATYINELNIAWPDGAVDPKSDGDNHLRLIKKTIKNTFPNLTGAMTATQANLNSLVGLSASVTSVQLNHLVGLTANVQSSLSGKASLTGATFSAGVDLRSTSGASPALRAYSTAIGGVSLDVNASGTMFLGQLGTAAAYEKPFMSGNRDAAVTLFWNGGERLRTDTFGVICTGAVTASDALYAGTDVSAGADVIAVGAVNAGTNVFANSGSVYDSSGKLKGYRTGVLVNPFPSSGAVFSGIPSDAVMIKIVFADASFSASSQDMALILSTGVDYNGRTTGISSSNTVYHSLWGTRVTLSLGMAASEKMGGSITLTKINAATWLVEALTGPWASTNGPASTVVGSVVVSAFPSTLTIGSLSGTGVYDSGVATMYVYQ